MLYETLYYYLSRVLFVLIQFFMYANISIKLTSHENVCNILICINMCRHLYKYRQKVNNEYFDFCKIFLMSFF